MRRFLILVLCSAGVAATVPAQAQRLRITVGGPNFRPYPVAAPDILVTGGKPEDGAQLARDLTGLLQADVELARSLEMVPPKTYLAPDKESWTAPNFSNWANVGASGLVRAGLEVRGKTVKVAFHFYDVAAQREAIGKTCETSVDNAASCVHQFLDAVIEFLTGEKGIFSSRIAFVRNNGRGHAKNILACDIDGGNVQDLVSMPKILNLLPSWDVSGKYLYFTSFINQNTDLYRLTVGTKHWEPISTEPGLNTGASVSPDGRRLAYTLSKDGNTEVYVADLDGHNPKRLTESWGQDLSPTWSPDSKRIAFVSSRSGNPHIYVMNADGSGQRRLTFKGNYNQEPDWSPRADGQIAFTARDEMLKFDVFLVNPETSDITRLTQDASNNDSPSHSPDGHHLAFTSTRGSDGKQLWIMDVDGNNQRRISTQPGEYETPAWGPRFGYK